MDEIRANIDLVFRNGLKDYEVLPPPDVWNCVDGRLTKKSKPAYLIRAAAFLAIAMTLSVLAYRWVGKTSGTTDNNVLALNEESAFPVSNDVKTTPVQQKREVSRTSTQSVKTDVQNSEVISTVPENEQIASTILKMPETNILLPLSTPSMSIIQHKQAFTETPNTNLTVDNVSVEYQDYLADNMTSEKTSRWSIAALATPTYYGTINSGSDDLSKQISATDQPILSYTGGVALSYKVNKRLSVQSGLFYSSVGQELDGINSFAGFQKYDNTKGDHNFEILTSNGTVFTSNPDVFLFADGNSDRIITTFNKDVFDPQKASLDYINNTMKQSFSYLELPVYLRYKVIDKTVDFNLIGGLSYNLLVNNSVYTVIDGNKYMIGTTEGLNMFSLSSSVGMGMEYNFSSKLSLNLEPTFRYYMNSFNNVNGSHFHPYSFGIFSGISYKF